MRRPRSETATALGLLLLTSTACAHASRSSGGRRIEAAVRAWLDDDDPERAHALTDGPGVDAPGPAERWLRALIAADRLDHRGLMHEVEALATAAPDGWGAEGAVRLALADPDLARRREPELIAVLDRLIEVTEDPVRKSTFIRLRLRLGSVTAARRDELLKVGGFATEVQITGPLGPVGSDLDTRRPPAPGSVERTVQGPRSELPLLSDGAPGLYRLRAQIPPGTASIVVVTAGPAEIRIADRPPVRRRWAGPILIPWSGEDGAAIDIWVHAQRGEGGAIAFSSRRPGRAEAPGSLLTVDAGSGLPELAERYARARLALTRLGEGPIFAREILDPIADRAQARGGAALHHLWALVLEARRYPDTHVDQALGRALEADPDHPSALLAVAERSAEHHPERALAALGRLSSRMAPSRQLELRVRALDELGQTEPALSAARALGRLGASASRSSLDTAARLLRRLDQLDGARRLEDLADAGRLDRTAQRAAERGDLASAFEQWSAWAAAAPNHRPQGLAKTAELALQRGQLDLADARAQEVLRLDPRHADALRVRLRVALAGRDAGGAWAHLAELEATGSAELEDWLGVLAAGGRAQDPIAEEYPSNPGAVAPRWSGAPSVLLLDRVIDRVRADGRAYSTRHLVRRIQSEEAAEAHEEPPLGASSSIVLDLATEDPSGQRRPAERAVQGERWAFASVDPGDDLVARWLVLDPPATPFGGYLRTFFFGAEVPVAQAEWIVVVPAGAHYRAKSFHGAPAPVVRRRPDGGAVLRFARSDIDAFVPEAQSPSADHFVPFAAVWVSFGEEELRAGRDLREAPAPYAEAPLIAAARAIEGDATGPREVADRLVRWILDEVESGDERAPDIALDTRAGDRDLLFAALARAAGLDAELALAHPGAAAAAHLEYPSPNRYPLRGTRVRLPEGAIWVRLGGDGAVVGPLPRGFAGGLWRGVGGRGPRPLDRSETRSPPAEVTVTAEIRDDGRAGGRLMATLHGDEAAIVRRRWRQTAPSDRAELEATWLAALLPGAEHRGARLAGTDRPWDPLVIELRFAHPALFERRGDRLASSPLLHSPLAERALGAVTLAELLAASQREAPLLLPTLEARTEWALRFSPGARVAAHPPDLSVASRFGQVLQRFEGQGEWRRIVRQRSSPGGVLGPRATAALVASLQSVVAELRVPLQVQLSSSSTRR